MMQRHALHAVLSSNAVQASGHESAYVVQPVKVGPRQMLSTSLWLATSAQRPRGPLLEQACELLLTLLRDRLKCA